MARAGSCQTPVVHLFKEDKNGISDWEAFFQLPGWCHVFTLGRRIHSAESRCKRVWSQVLRMMRNTYSFLIRVNIYQSALTLTNHYIKHKVSLWKSSECMFISFFRHSTCQGDRAHITFLFSLSPLRILTSCPHNISEKNLNTGEINPRKST